MPDFNSGTRKELFIYLFILERDVLLITRRMKFSLAALVPALIPMLVDFKEPSLWLNSLEMSKLQRAVL